jgi:ubiquinone/menaquinone biosynthesis C-methylase UbiE
MRSLGAKTCMGLDHYLPTLRSAAATYGDSSFACCDAMHLCLPNDSVDVVVSCETIEHFDDPSRFVAECARVLRPGGLMICSTPNHAVYRWDGQNPFHVHEMNVKEFRGLFKDLFTDIKLYGQWQILYPAHVLKRILRDFLQSFRIKSLLKRAIRHGAHTVLVETALHSEFDVRPYAASLFVKPMYLVAVARKPLPVGARQAAKT